MGGGVGKGGEILGNCLWARETGIAGEFRADVVWYLSSKYKCMVVILFVSLQSDHNSGTP